MLVCVLVRAPGRLSSLSPPRARQLQPGEETRRSAAVSPVRLGCALQDPGVVRVNLVRVNRPREPAEDERGRRALGTTTAIRVRRFTTGAPSGEEAPEAAAGRSVSPAGMSRRVALRAGALGARLVHKFTPCNR